MTESAGGRRLASRGTGVLIATILVVFALLCSTLVLAFPAQDFPRRVDVVVVLGGPVAASVAYGVELAESGVADHVLISTPPGEGGRAGKSECAKEHSVTVVCFTPRNATTEGEAQSSSWQAEQRGWSSMLVVTARFHVARSRFIFDRCHPGNVFVTATRVDIGWQEWAYQFAYQPAAFAKAFLVTKC